jgi:hypothetical protein
MKSAERNQGSFDLNQGFGTTTFKSFPNIAAQKENVEFDVTNPEQRDIRIRVSLVLSASGSTI